MRKYQHQREMLSVWDFNKKGDTANENNDTHNQGCYRKQTTVRTRQKPDEARDGSTH